MINYARYIIILFCIFTLSYALPKALKIVFFPSNTLVMVNYSLLEDDFFINDGVGYLTIYTDTKNNKYTKEEYIERLPLLYYKNLHSKNLLPDSIAGKKIIFSDLVKNNYFAKVTVQKTLAPQPLNIPLYEPTENPIYFDVYNYFISYKHSFKFYEASTLEVDKQLSEKTTNELLKFGYEFPTKKVFSDFRVHKNYNLGYYLLDNNNHLFQLQFINRSPKVDIIKLPAGVVIKHIECTDPLNKEIIAILISDKNEIFLHLGLNGSIVKLNIDNYDASRDRISVFGNPFFKTFAIGNVRMETVYVVNDNYEITKSYSLERTPEKFKIYDMVKSLIFPFTVGIPSGEQVIAKPSLKISRNLWALPLHVFLMLAFYGIKKRKTTLLELLIVFITGIYGLITLFFVKPL